MRRPGQVRSSQHQPAPDRGEERLRPVRSGRVLRLRQHRRVAQHGRQLRRRTLLAELGGQRLHGQPGPGAQRLGAELCDPGEEATDPRPEVLVEQDESRMVGARCAGGREVAQVGVGVQEHDEVVGLRRWRHVQRPQEARDAVTGVTAEHALVPEMDRRVRVDLEVEQVRMLRRRRRTREFERVRHGRRAGVGTCREVRERAEESGAAHPPVGTSLVRRPTGPPMRNASAVGLSGRISQRGRRSPLGETTVALRVFSSHSR